MAVKQKVILFFMVPSRQLGGCTSFTVHLYRALAAMGYAPVIVRVARAKTTTPTVKPFAYGLMGVTMSPEAALAAAKKSPSLIVYAFWRRMGDLAAQLICNGVPVIVHDPAEFVDESLDLYKAARTRVGVIRTANAKPLIDRGLNVHVMPHPYCPSPVPMAPAVPTYHAISVARVDTRKRTDVIVAANNLVPPERACHLYGEISRIYEYHSLRQKHPDWRRWYHGEFADVEGEAVRLTRQARVAVDLTEIKGDGGGTQYCFFEAWNAGVPLVMNAGWAVDPRADEVKDGDSCIMVRTAEDLAEALKMDTGCHLMKRAVEGGRARLEAHSPANVVPAYINLMNG